MRTRFKANAVVIVPIAFGLDPSDETVSRHRAKSRASSKEMSDEELRQKITRQRVVDLIGTAEKKDTFFIYGRGTVRRSFEGNVYYAYIDLSHAKRAEPKGPFEHRAIKEVIIKTIFIASRGSECLADAFQASEKHIFDPVPLRVIALAATAVKSWRCFGAYFHMFSYSLLPSPSSGLLCALGVEEWITFECAI